MPYKNNFGTNDWPEFQQWPNGDSVNGRTGSMSPGARTSQTTQSQPGGGAVDPYAAYKSTAASWGFPQSTKDAGAAAPASSPYTASALAGVLTGNAAADDRDPGNKDHGPGSGDPSTPTPTPTPVGAPTTPYNPIAGHPLRPSTGNPNLPSTPAPFGPGNPDPNAPPENTNVTPGATPPDLTGGGGSPTQITPHPPPSYPSVGDLIKSLQGLNEPLFRQEQADYSRESAAMAGHTGAINSGGFPVAYQRGLSDLINKQNAGLSNEAFTANSQNLDRALQQYGIDINDKQFWANLALKAYQGDQQAQQFYAYLVSQLGLTPAQIANIIGGFTPGVVFNPNP